MGKNYTSYVIVLIVLFSLSIFFNIIGLLTTIFAWNFVTAAADVGQGYMIYNVIMSLITLSIAIIYLVQLARVKKSLFMWTHIAFGYYCVLTLINLVLGITLIYKDSLTLGMGIVSAVIGLGAAIAVWITFYKHLLKAKATKKLDFS